MEYRAKRPIERLTWVVLNTLVWVGILGILWNLFKPEGWLYWGIDLVERNEPNSFYFLAIGVVGAYAAKAWLDGIDRRAPLHLITAAVACAGTFFILKLLLHL